MRLDSLVDRLHLIGGQDNVSSPEVFQRARRFPARKKISQGFSLESDSIRRAGNRNHDWTQGRYPCEAQLSRGHTFLLCNGLDLLNDGKVILHYFVVLETGQVVTYVTL